jgi:hypothetical protein
MEGEGCRRRQPQLSPPGVFLDNRPAASLSSTSRKVQGELEVANVDLGNRRRRAGPIAQFAVKAVIVAGAFIVSASIIMDMAIGRLDAMIDRRLDQFHVDGSQVWSRIEHGLDRAADDPAVMPPERQERLIADLRRISHKWRPMLLAGWSALADGQ